MRIGVVFPQTEIGADPGAVREYAQAAEELGYSHLLAYDHVLGADLTNRPDWRGAYNSQDMFHELFVLFGYLAYVLVSGATARRRWWRALALSGCPAVVCTVAYSRMYLDAHWLSDVLGGMSGGLAYLLLAIWLIGSDPAPAVASLPVVPVAVAEPTLPSVS